MYLHQAAKSRANTIVPNIPRMATWHQNPVNPHILTCQKAQLPYNFHGLPCHQNMVFFGFKNIQGDDGQNAKLEITKQWPEVVDNVLVATSIFYINSSGLTTL